MLPRSLTGKLMLASLLHILAATAVGVLAMLLFVYRSPSSIIRTETEDAIEHVETGLQIDAAGHVKIVLPSGVASTYAAIPKDAAYLVLDAAGHPVAQSAEGSALQRLREMGDDESSVQVTDDDAGIHLLLMQRQMTRDGKSFRIRVAGSDRLILTLRDYAKKLYLRATFVTLFLALLAFMLVVYVTVRRMIRPLGETSEFAAKLEPRNLSMRLRSEGLPTEIVPLIDAFNAALVRLENGFRMQQEFLAAAAHELKTPLALLQAEIELGGAVDAASLLRDTQLMARIVHQLLHLAEASEGRNYTFEPVSLHAELETAAHYLQRLAQQQAVQVRVEPASRDLPAVMADRGAVFVLVKNLLENAIRHAPAESVVRIDVNANGFSVEDQGTGVAAKDAPHLFKRFWRAKRSDDGGAGLGLAICKEICLAHRWSIWHESTSEGGARFVVSMQTTLHDEVVLSVPIRSDRRNTRSRVGRG